MKTSLLTGISLWLATGVLVSADTASYDLEQCKAISRNSDRLQCYDRLSGRLLISTNVDLIQPEQEFLISQLRVRPEVSDFKLTVADFLQLLSAARTEEGFNIGIKGWSRDQNKYALNVDFREPLQLIFTYHSDRHYSILAPVGKGDRRVNATEFIYTIAAMSP